MKITTTMTFIDELRRFIDEVTANHMSGREELDTLHLLEAEHQDQFCESLFELLSDPDYCIASLIIMQRVVITCNEQQFSNLASLICRQFVPNLTVAVASAQIKRQPELSTLLTQQISQIEDVNYIIKVLRLISKNEAFTGDIFEFARQLIDQSPNPAIVVASICDQDVSGHYFGAILHQAQQQIAENDQNAIETISVVKQIVIDHPFITQKSAPILFELSQFCAQHRVVPEFLYQLTVNTLFCDIFEIVSNDQVITLANNLLGWSVSIPITEGEVDPDSVQTQVQCSIKALFEHNFRIQAPFRQTILDYAASNDEAMIVTAALALCGFDLQFQSALQVELFQILVQKLDEHYSKSRYYVTTVVAIFKFFQQQFQLPCDVSCVIDRLVPVIYTAYSEGDMQEKVAAFNVLAAVIWDQSFVNDQILAGFTHVLEQSFEQLQQTELTRLRTLVFDCFSGISDLISQKQRQQDETMQTFLELGAAVCEYLIDEELVCEINEQLTENVLQTDVDEYELRRQSLVHENAEFVCQIFYRLLQMKNCPQLLQLAERFVLSFVQNLQYCAERTVHSQAAEQSEFVGVEMANTVSFVVQALCESDQQFVESNSAQLTALAAAMSQVRSVLSRCGVCITDVLLRQKQITTRQFEILVANVAVSNEITVSAVLRAVSGHDQAAFSDNFNRIVMNLVENCFSDDVCVAEEHRVAAAEYVARRGSDEVFVANLDEIVALLGKNVVRERVIGLGIDTGDDEEAM